MGRLVVDLDDQEAGEPMTALSAGPWELDTGYIFSAEVPPRCVGSVAGWFVNPPTEEQLANGRAMASAHEALAVLAELAKPEDELRKEYEAETGEAVPKVEVYSPAWAHYFHWIWLRNGTLRGKAAAVLEKAKVTP